MNKEWLKYSIYFGELLKKKELPELSDEEYDRMYNIIHLENRIIGMKSVRNYSYFKFQMKLNDLTGCFSPETLLQQMVESSKPKKIAY